MLETETYLASQNQIIVPDFMSVLDSSTSGYWFFKTFERIRRLMKIELDCLPCFLQQILRASRMVTEDRETQGKILKDAIKIIKDYDSFRFAPEVGRAMHFMVK